MKKFICLSAALALVVACGKDSFETKPQLKIVSVDPEEKVVAFNQPLSVTLEFTDKEGDVSDSIFVVRERLNASDPETKFPSPYKIPDFPNTTKGEIQVYLDFDEDLTLDLLPVRIPGSTPSRNEPDTLRIKFVAKDKGGNFSDTATLDNIFVERL